jgi:hypothetical protein
MCYSLESCATSTVTISASAPNSFNSLAARAAAKHRPPAHTTHPATQQGAIRHAVICRHTQCSLLQSHNATSGVLLCKGSLLRYHRYADASAVHTLGLTIPCWQLAAFAKRLLTSKHEKGPWELSCCQLLQQGISCSPAPASVPAAVSSQTPPSAAHVWGVGAWSTKQRPVMCTTCKHRTKWQHCRCCDTSMKCLVHTFSQCNVRQRARGKKLMQQLLAPAS